MDHLRARPRCVLAAVVRRTSIVLVLLASVVTPVAYAQDSAPEAVIAPDADIARLTLVKGGDGSAVIRFGQSDLQTLGVGDRVGRSHATVTEAVSGRLVLEEVSAGPGGKPRRALIVIRDGQTGGKRFLSHPDLDAPIALRPQILDAAAPALNGSTNTPSLR